MKEQIIVLGLYLPGIDIIKYFRKKGFQCIGIDCIKNSPGLYLRNVKTFLCTDPEKDSAGVIEFLIQLGSKSSGKPILFNTSDKFVKLIIDNSTILKNHFIFNISEPGITEILMNKKLVIDHALKKGVPVPQTFFNSHKDSFKDSFKDFLFPCVIRPEQGNSWTDEPLRSIVNQQKLLLVNNQDELEDRLNQILPFYKNLIIQEVVQGKDENLLYTVCYVGKKGQILGYFTGQKLRISPVHFGSATYMKTYNSDEVLPLCQRLFDGSGYNGPAGVEFKKDDRDGIYKLIEINTRFGLWDIMGKKMGVDLFEIAYLDLTGVNVTPCIPVNREYFWLSLSRDLSVIRQYHSEGIISWRDWIKAWFKDVYVADLYLDEPRIMYSLYFKKVVRWFKKSFIHV
jgi:D-aspartate ligase